MLRTVMHNKLWRQSYLQTVTKQQEYRTVRPVMEAKGNWI
jgi:hypothetical protein